VRDWIAAGRAAAKSFLDHDCVGLAKQVAYSSLLAFFPAAILLVGLLGLIGAYGALESFLAPVAPGAVTDLIETLRRDTSGTGGSAAAFALGAAGAIWAASGATGSLIGAIDRAYGRSVRRPFWLARLVAIGVVLVSGLVVAGTLLLVVFGGPLGDAIARRARLGGGFDLAWNLLRWPIAFGAVLVLIGLLYAVGADRPARAWRWITPGSVLGALLWLAVSGLFALYTSLSDSYSRTYGSLAGGIVLLLWLNLTALAILFGAELNAELERRGRIRAAGGDRAGSTRVPRA
jgi:membrane protein